MSDGKGETERSRNEVVDNIKTNSNEQDRKECELG
jgi:hypothetical protein